MENQDKTITLQTYRFILSNEMIEHLSNFAKVHQYDDRKIFKEEWKTWLTDENIKSLINEEIKRLSNNGCNKDIINKMYKSARYYYRNKPIIKEKNTNERKKYEHTSKEIQKRMDEHIYRQINENTQQIKNTNNEMIISKVSPGESFENYLKENKQLLLNTLKENNNENPITKEECENLINKYKKTYKNRFYNIRVSINNI